MMRLLIALAACAATAGCVSAKVTRLVPTVYRPISAGQVTVLEDISALEADTIIYDRIATIRLGGDVYGITDAEDMVKKARQLAARIGANAVIMGEYSPSDGLYTHSAGSAVAIRYRIVSDTLPNER